MTGRKPERPCLAARSLRAAGCGGASARHAPRAARDPRGADVRPRPGGGPATCTSRIRSPGSRFPSCVRRGTSRISAPARVRPAWSWRRSSRTPASSSSNRSAGSASSSAQPRERMGLAQRRGGVGARGGVERRTRHVRRGQRPRARVAAGALRVRGPAAARGRRARRVEGSGRREGGGGRRRGRAAARARRRSGPCPSCRSRARSGARCMWCARWRPRRPASRADRESPQNGR